MKYAWLGGGTRRNRLFCPNRGRRADPVRAWCDQWVATLCDECPHRYAPLSLRKVDGSPVECYHQEIGFDLHGECIANPHSPLVSALRVRTFLREAQRHATWVWLGGSEPANPPAITPLDFFKRSPSTMETHGKEIDRSRPSAPYRQHPRSEPRGLSSRQQPGGGATTRAKSTVTTEGETVQAERAGRKRRGTVRRMAQCLTDIRLESWSCISVRPRPAVARPRPPRPSPCM